jgi:Zn-dependent protease with chaperone function
MRGRWFDGRSSRAREVAVRLLPGPRGPALELRPDEAAAAPVLLRHDEIGWPEAWSAKRVPRKVVVDLHAQGSLELDDPAGWQAALAAAGGKPTLAQRMQTRWPVFIAVLLLAGAALLAFYRWGTPWAATQLTRQVPLSWETTLAERGLADIDQSWLKPSRLAPERQQELRRRFEALAAQVQPPMRRYGDYRPRLQLQFRAGLGANAFALPGGMIVMTDGLVAAAAKHGLPDEALLGVLAHEIGHVLHRHTTRMLVEQAVLNVGLGLAVGDVSSLLSVGGSLLTGLAYRRGHEGEADCFAVALMRQAGLPTAPMADLLLQLDGRGRAAAGAQGAGEAGSGWGSLLSSHPETPQRARDLKEGHVRCG